MSRLNEIADGHPQARVVGDFGQSRSRAQSRAEVVGYRPQAFSSNGADKDAGRTTTTPHERQSDG